MPTEAQMRAEDLRMQRQYDSRREDDMVAQQVSDYYSKPQNDTQFNYLYVTPGAEDAGFKEWTRDSILSNYTRSTLNKIGWCVEELRILEMMSLDAIEKGDTDFIENFAKPLIRFNTSEKFALENGNRNIDGYGGQLSRSTFNNIQQFRYSEDFARQQAGGGLFGKLKMPKFGGGGGGGGWGNGNQQMGWSGV